MRKNKLEELNRIKEELTWIKSTSIDNPSRNFLSIETYKFDLPDGRSLVRQKLVKNVRDGSSVLIVPRIRENGEYLVCIEPRVFTEEKVSIGFPAGYIEKDEKPIEAAKRELLEETGYTSDNVIYLGSGYQDEGISGAKNYLFFADSAIKVCEQKLDYDEFVKYMSFSYNELLELEDMGYLSGLNSKLVLCKIRELKKGRR